MESNVPTREEALALLKQYTRSEALINHAKAVEGVMRYMARKFGENEEKWGVIGLVHDLDYEQFPEKHCIKVREILDENGLPEDYIRAVVSHGWGICSDVKPESLLEKTLFAIDQFVLRGGRAVVCVDPYCVSDRPNPMERQMGKVHCRKVQLL